MPRTTNVAVQNNFLKGLITEATALNSPENACTETYNCIFNRNGMSERRHAFQIETNATPLEVTVSNKAISSYVWKNVASQGDLRFVVLQIGHSIYFFKVVEGHPLSEYINSTIINMSTHLAPNAPSQATDATEFNFSSGNGFLFITSPYHESLYVEYDEDTDVFTINEITIEIRDTIGYVDDPYEEDERPDVIPERLDDGHLYNLFNQGWTGRHLYMWTIGSDEQDSNKRRHDSPSNCDVDWLFKDEKDKFQFSPDRIDDNRLSSLGPRGHFKHNLYDIDRSYETEDHPPNKTGYINISGRAERFQILNKRVAISAFFAGRIMFSGLEADGHNSKIFFSQIIEKPEQFGRCYQKNDPTAEKLFDLLPTDGGYIDIIEAGAIKKLFTMANSLIAFCTNGIWAITGSQGLGFIANDYSVVKISSIETPSTTTFVDAEGTPYWWCESGIYTITQSQGGFQVVNLTDDTIKTLFDEIPFQNKAFARGVFDPLNKTIQWLYRSTNAPTLNDKYTYDRILNYNLLTKAFFPWSFGTTTVKVKGILDLSNFGSGSILRNVTELGEQVTDIDDVIISYSLDGSVAGSTTKYVVTYDNGDVQTTFAECNENTDGYQDWTRIDGEETAGESYTSYFVSGYSLKGQAIRRWQPIYVSVFSQCEEDSIYDFRGRWNFSTSGSASRWSTLQRATNLAGNFKFVTNKFKVRGDGVACQFEVRSVDDNPFFIAGWASLDSENKWV